MRRWRRSVGAQCVADVDSLMREGRERAGHMFGIVVVLAVAVVAAEGEGEGEGARNTRHIVTDEEYSRFPRLFHLDDYEGCLAHSDGLYCVGTFHVAPATQPHPTYDLLKEYSKDSRHFNHTQLHRGYCVSERCAALSAEPNASRRFERCAGQWGTKRGFKLSLLKLQYCRTHAQEFARTHNTEPLDRGHRIFLAVVALLVGVNFLGTAYDAILEDDSKKSRYLVVWSIRSNWRRLTATYADGDPRLIELNPLQGIRVLLMGLILATHAGCIHDMLYIYNPRFVEKMSHHPTMTLFFNGTSIVQVFVVISNFLLAYNILIHSKEYDIGLKHLPFCLVKRLARIFPVYMLVVGYAATWWPQARGGPLWPTTVEAESEVCRRKFWAQALFINNLVEPQSHCLVQTWFLAVDMQLYVVSSVLTLSIVQFRLRALRILSALMLASCLLNAGLAYAFDWQTLLYFVSPETLRNMYYGVPSFAHLYMSPWGSLPACFVGLFMAHLHYDLQEKGFKISAHKWFKIPYYLAVPLIVGWILAGNWARDYTSREFVALYVAVERPVISGLYAITLFGMLNGLDHFLKGFFGWRGWHAMGRMSLSALMIHWCVNMIIAASRPQPIATSLLDVITDFLATGVWTYLLAIPLTLLVEMPVQRFISALMY